LERIETLGIGGNLPDWGSIKSNTERLKNEVFALEEDDKSDAPFSNALPQSRSHKVGDK
jgi:hypothetical protein